MFEAARDGRIRAAAFAFLDAQRTVHGDVLPWNVLLRGFDFEGRRVPLVGPQGIFKPEVLHTVPLTILTVPEVQGRPRPYDDAVGEDGLLWYSYRGSNPGHHENVGLREAMRRSIPLIYLFGIVTGHYMPVYPVLIVGDQPERL